MTEHFLTQNPSDNVRVQQSQGTCTPQGIYLHCEGELSGIYMWSQENSQTNYVLFVLSERSNIVQINLTYVVQSNDQEPKISFCPLPDGTLINASFTDLMCRAVSIQPSLTREAMTVVLNVTFNTTKVAMEVITDGIKADFVANEVQFYGSTEVTATG